MTVREVPLAEAAAQLGLTTEALRQRLKRGKSLRGVKRAGEWYVLLDGTPPDARPIAQPVTTVHEQSRLDGRPDATAHEQSRPDASELATLREALGFAQERVRFLEAELERADAAQSELRRLLALALQQQQALPPPATDKSSLCREDSADREAGKRFPDSPRPWWRRWWPWTA
jgi:hypothetical protein